MLCVISPAKRLDEKPRDLSDGVALTAPKFASDAWKLVQAARGLSVEDLRKLMGLSEPLARLNRGRKPPSGGEIAAWQKRLDTLLSPVSA